VKSTRAFRPRRAAHCTASHHTAIAYLYHDDSSADDDSNCLLSAESEAAAVEGNVISRHRLLTTPSVESNENGIFLHILRFAVHCTKMKKRQRNLAETYRRLAY
jgi:hypothetical protein